MAVENIAWMTHGGKHSAALGRMVASLAAEGGEGVMAIGDLRVRAAAVANGTVIVAPGGAVMVNRYPNQINEGYVARNPEDTIVNITPNAGGATRYDLVIARIDDWNFPGAQAEPETLPTDAVPSFKLEVIVGVASSVKTAAELALNYPAIALARIAIPAGTGAITNAMITPLRKKASPRRERSLTTRALTAGQEDDLSTAAPAVETWPDVATWSIEVPSWAARAKVKADWSGVNVPAGSTRAGALWVYIGIGNGAGFATQKTGVKAEGAAAASRQTCGLSDDVVIPAGLRGQTITVSLMGNVEGGAGANIKVDSYSSISLDMEFVEAPVEDA